MSMSTNSEHENTFSQCHQEVLSFISQCIILRKQTNIPNTEQKSALMLTSILLDENVNIS
jgi:hypothetical protein